jgi:hypothetical protein
VVELTTVTQINTILPFWTHRRGKLQHWMSTFGQWWLCPESEQVRNEIATANN